MSTPGGLQFEHLKWCKQERERLQHQREILASGACRMGYNVGSGWIDSTSETLAQLDATLAELNQVIGDKLPIR